MYLKGGSSEDLRKVGIRIMFGLVERLNATPERSEAASDSVIPSDVIFGADGFTYLDGVIVCEVIAKN